MQNVLHIEQSTVNRYLRMPKFTPGDKFTPGELQVMRILWQHGELKPADIAAKFARAIKDPALRSYLTILVEKGHVTRERRGKAFFYRAKTKQSSVFREKLRELVDVFCGGSNAALVQSLIKSEKLSVEELERLQQLAAEEQTEAPLRKKSPKNFPKTTKRSKRKPN